MKVLIFAKDENMQKKNTAKARPTNVLLLELV